MATPGTNIQAGQSEKIFYKILKALGLPKDATMVGAAPGPDGTVTTRPIALLTKAGAPASNTAADAPTGFGDILWDSTNKDVYRCTAYTDVNTFTWTQIAG